MPVLGVLEPSRKDRPHVEAVLLGKARSGKTALSHCLLDPSLRPSACHAYAPTIAVECRRGLVKIPQEGEVTLSLWEVGHGGLMRAQKKDPFYLWADVVARRQKPFGAALVVVSADDRKGVQEASEFVAHLTGSGIQKERMVMVLTTAAAAAPSTVKAQGLAHTLGIPVVVFDFAAPRSAAEALLDLICLGPAAAPGVLSRLTR
eukprot:TRINITY_DN76020_c0_g1_i1.p1 TRINITY_DN76020_c0_g1~~TRINITY_DN76020_c0_g1_i1.p1  ORF type:complete len:204 (+),score=38.68 TRINITY_DN76020_c0_g1_i1:84-695(+)